MEIKTVPSSVWNFLWSYFSRQKFLFFCCLAAIIGGEFLMRLSLYYAAEIVAVISGGEERTAALKRALTLVVIASSLLLLKNLIQSIMRFLEANFMPHCLAAVAKDLFDYVHQQSPVFFAEEMAGNISSKTKTIIDSIYPMYYFLIWGFLTPLSAMLITLGFVIKVNVTLALILAVLNITVFYVSYCLSRRMVQISKKRAQTMSEASGVLVDSISNAVLVKNFSNYHFERQNYFKFMKAAIAADRAEIKKFGIISVWQNLLRALIQILFYALPVWYWYIDEIDIANFVFLQSLIAMLNQIFGMLSMNIVHFFKIYGNISDGLTLLSKPCEVHDADDADKLNLQKGEISFVDLNYHYKNMPNLFSGFNLHIAGGEKVGFVGRSGSGKTTLIKLLSRYYDIQHGKITIDGQDIAHIAQDSLRRQIALIPQDPNMFNRSIMENIRYGRTSATDEEVYAAARRAYIHDFIMRLPNGYQSKVGERGVMLSGGERQRIAIARAILKDAPILILDEATSALDSESEKYIQESLKDLMKNKTVIAIAHRLSTIKEMDRIIVMDKGRIVESGSHTALLRRQGVYKSFFAMQTSGLLEIDGKVPCSK